MKTHLALTESLHVMGFREDLNAYSNFFLFFLFYLLCLMLLFCFKITFHILPVSTASLLGIPGRYKLN